MQSRGSEETNNLILEEALKDVKDSMQQVSFR